jgi:hypothetical protein
VTHGVNALCEAEVDGVRGIFEELFTTSTYALDRPRVDRRLDVRPSVPKQRARREPYVSLVTRRSTRSTLHGTEAGSAAHVVHDAGDVSVREATDFTGDEPAEISG